MWAIDFHHKQSEAEAEAGRHVSFLLLFFFLRWVPLVLMLFGFIASPMVVALSLYVPSIFLFLYHIIISLFWVLWVMIMFGIGCREILFHVN